LPAWRDLLGTEPAPLTDAVRRRVTSELQRSQARLDRAQAAASAARSNIAREERLSYWLTHILNAGFGHVWSRLGDPGDWMQRDREPHCRVCLLTVSCVAAAKDCPGDGHTCPVLLDDPSLSPTATKFYGYDKFACHQPGAMNAACTEWTCNLGHVIAEDHEVYWRRGSHRCPSVHCAWTDFDR
jgi:hypothetical protein